MSFVAQYLNEPQPLNPPGVYCGNCGHTNEMYHDRKVPRREGEDVPCCGDKHCGCAAHMVATFEVTLLDFFASSLQRMSPAQRKMTMEELENRVCLFCGAADPDCPCWLEEKREVPS